MKLFERINAIRDAGGLNTSERAVLYTLASYADEHGRCWPGLDTIAQGAGLKGGRRSATRVIRRLEQAGAFVVERQEGGCHRYLLTLERLETRDIGSRVPVTQGPTPPGRRVTPPVTQSPGTRDTESPEPNQGTDPRNRSKEPPKPPEGGGHPLPLFEQPHSEADPNTQDPGSETGGGDTDDVQRQPEARPDSSAEVREAGDAWDVRTTPSMGPPTAGAGPDPIPPAAPVRAERDPDADGTGVGHEHELAPRRPTEGTTGAAKGTTPQRRGDPVGPGASGGAGKRRGSGQRMHDLEPGAGNREADEGRELTLPPWTPRANRCGGHPRAEVAQAVLTALEAITGRAPNPKRSGTAAKPLLALWRAAGLPAPDVFVEEVTLIAKWAQCSPDPLAARDIRAVDWTNGKDRSRSPHTLAVQDRYDERLNAARDWQDAGCPVANDDGAQASAPRWGLTTTTRGTSPEWELLQCLKRYGGIPGQLRDLHTDADRAKQHAEALRRLGDGHAGRGLKVMSEAFLAANKGSLGEMEHRYRDAFRAVVRGAA